VVSVEPVQARRSRLRAACGVIVGLYAVCMGFLVFAIYQEDHSLNVPLAILFVAGVVAAGVVFAVRARWSAWTAVAYSIITAIADGPHQLAEMVHPSSHFPVSFFILLVTVAAIAVSLWLALSSGRRDGAT